MLQAISEPCSDRHARELAKTERERTNVQGFVTRDRRKDSARESDQRLAELEQTYAEALQEGAHLM